jgi:murein DD-endopeptidase MepM/ murein hydrolase activator NlpD
VRRRRDGRRPLLVGLVCGLGAILLLALQAVSRPLEGAAHPPRGAAPLPAAAFEPVPLPRLAVVERHKTARRAPAEGDRPDQLGWVGESGTRALAGEPAGRLVEPASAAILPERVLAGLRPPVVVRFRPRDGSTGVAPSSWLSVRFSAPMDRASTERAFEVLVAGRPIDGRRWWAEDDTVLVLDPDGRLPAGVVVRLVVGTTARSRIGLPLVARAEATIRVAAAASARPSPSGEGGDTSQGWRWPLLGPITQRFGESLTRYGWHNGIDIDGATGDPVVAARAGRVTVAGRYDVCGGLEVHLDHGAGLESWYRHLSVVEVAVGAWVVAGERIGRVGDTGCSLGSHLHFAIRRDGTWVDPLRYLPAR